MSSEKDCIKVIKEFGFTDEEGTYFRGDCVIYIMNGSIVMAYNVPGVENESIGPPLPSKKELREFINRNKFWR